MDYLFRLEELRQHRTHRRVDTVLCVLLITTNPLKNHVFSRQLPHIESNLDEIYNLILESAHVTVWKRNVDKNKSVEEPTRPHRCEVDSSFYFTADLMAVL